MVHGHMLLSTTDSIAECAISYRNGRDKSVWGFISKVLIGAALVLLILFGIQELFPHANVPHFVGGFFNSLFHFVKSLGGK